MTFSADPAVTRIEEKVYPLVPTSLVWLLPGSNGPATGLVSVPTVKVSFTVWVVPVSGNEALTLAEVATPTTGKETVWPPREPPEVTRRAATVKVLVWPALTVIDSPRVTV